jgi:hypothetical protein
MFHIAQNDNEMRTFEDAMSKPLAASGCIAT